MNIGPFPPPKYDLLYAIAPIERYMQEVYSAVPCQGHLLSIYLNDDVQVGNKQH